MFSFFKRSSGYVDLSFIGTDMHSHLLPAIDDGSKNMGDTILFIKELKQLGFKKIITTPHILPGMYENSPKTILPVLDKVKDSLNNLGIDMPVEAAAEYMIDHEFEQSIKRGDQLLCFGDNYILIEMSYMAASPYLQQVIFDLKLLGLQPILAHPERYSYYHSNFNFYTELKERGCLLQLNILSLAGYYGGGVKKIAQKLLKHSMIDFVGTDMHHQNHLHSLQMFAKQKDLHNMLKDAPLLNATL
jgi:tyrosine-protein phosphatase YwqE